MNKKSQITIFVILAIVVLIIAGVTLYFVLKTKTPTQTTTPERSEVSNELKPLQQYIEGCIATIGHEGVISLGQHGGYIDPNDEYLSGRVFIKRPSLQYDSACIPAILYNKQKEKQIRCKYLSCLEKQSSAGIPTITCEKDYEMDTCLYIDSAQWKFEDVPFMSALMSGMIRSGLAFATSLGVQSAYSAACSGYNSGLTSHTLPEASWSALPCGMTGLFLRWREVEQVFSPTQWKGITTSSRPDDPATIHDYCQGVDYSG